MSQQQLRGADIRVMGLVHPSHLVEDISVGVAFGVTVIIPAGKAALSKDLWTAISQKRLFKMPSAGPPGVVVAPGQVAATAKDTANIQTRLQSLEARNGQLEDESRKLREQLAASQEKQQSTLEAILEAVKAAPGVGHHVQGSNGAVSTQAASDVADGSAPTFIPEAIRPKEAEVRIESQDASAASDVSSVTDRLRKMRQGNQ